MMKRFPVAKSAGVSNDFRLTRSSQADKSKESIQPERSVWAPFVDRAGRYFGQRNQSL
jgi:hypothetical protein